MSMFGATAMGAPRASALQNQSGDRNATLGRKYQAFSNPFFDLASTYTPPTIKGLFAYCRHYHLTHGIINAIITKASEYPVTDLILSHKDRPVKDRWDELLNGVLNYRVHQFEVNLEYFCFAAGTPVVTRGGTVPIEDLTGETVDVLSKGGVWRKATFASYGSQELYEVEFSRGETLIATAEHQWPVIDTNRKERTVTTVELKGKYLQRNVAPRPARSSEYEEGLRHGIVFGDGTLANEGRQARVMFYAKGKKQELIRFFESYTCSEHIGGEYIAAYGLPPAFKALPAVSASNEYWYGFACGLLATDGSVTAEGDVQIHQKHGCGLDAIAQQLPRFGMLGKQLRTYDVVDAYQPIRMDRVALSTAFMQAEDFVRSDQRERFEAAQDESSGYGFKAKVMAVRPTGRREEVFCCVEPETHTFTVGNGVLTGNCYGNAFVSPSLPFTKVLQCRGCNAEHQALQTRALWRYSAKGFWLSCSRCGQTDYAIARDDYYPRLSDISLVRWNPELVNTFYNESTGRTDYTLDFSTEFKNGITIGRKDLVATTPQAILAAVNRQKTLVFDQQAVFHMRRPGLSGMARWGIPLMMPVLKDAFFMQIMKKAQESVLMTHLVPQVFLFPQPATSGADPFTTTSLADWRDHIRRELARQRIDPSYYGILPFPLGHQTIGENGKSLLLMPEIQQMAEQICIGMGFPVDLVFGNGTYAGSSVNMRMLENFFMSNMHGHVRMVHWVMKHFGSFLNWPIADARFKAFRMADDLQRTALYLQMQQQDTISETTLLSQVDLKVEDETQLRSAEMIIKMEAAKRKAEFSAEVQGQAQVIMAKYQAQAQGSLTAATQRDAAARRSPFDDSMGSDITKAPGVTLDAAAAALAAAVRVMPPEQRERYMSQLRGSLPELEQMVQQQQGQGLPGMPGDPSAPANDQSGQDPAAAATQGQQGGGPVDMRAQPSTLPPRRAGAA